jgi:hypothetical protein
MRVIDTEDHSWFLFEHEGGLYLDVNCSNSAIGYSYTIRLSEAEIESYEAGGHAFLSELARDIDYSVPILADTASVYKDRRVAYEISELATEAVNTWRQTKNL